MTAGVIAAHYADAAATTYDSAVLADSPQVYWKFADASGTTAPVDSSGHGRTGSVQATVAFGGAALVTGDAQTSATMSAGRVKIDYDSSWMSVQAWTIEAIVKPSSVSGLKTIGGIDNNGGQLKHRLRINGSNLEFLYDGGGTIRTLSASAVMGANVIKHVAATYLSTGSAFLYVNGSQVATTSTTGAMNTNTVPELLCGSLTGTSEPFVGLMARFAVYTSQLSVTRIAAHAALV